MIKDKDGHRYCQVCGKIIDNLHFNCKTCGPECRLIYNNLDKNNKICKGCGNLFYGTRHQIYCEDCRSKPDFKLNIYRNSITYKEQIIICPRCSQVWKIKTVVNGLGLDVKVSDSLCPSCSKKSKENNSIRSSARMKENNPMRNKDTARKVSKTREKQYLECCKIRGIPVNLTKRQKTLADRKKLKNLSREEIIHRISERMKINNPMYNPKTREKVQNTIKRKIKSGEFKIKKGNERSNYKGGQKINHKVRLCLKDWRKNELTRTDYTCEICNKRGGKLHIHHKKPLREIIDEICKINNTTRIEIDSQKDSDLYNKVFNQVLEYHKNNSIGLVVCPDCHEKVDKYYHKNKKNENKKHKKRK